MPCGLVSKPQLAKEEDQRKRPDPFFHPQRKRPDPFFHPFFILEHDAYAHYPLHLACNRGQFEAVKLLVEHGAHINLQCRCKYSAIMHLKANHLEIAKFLVEHGANTELVNQFGKGMDAELKKALGGPV